MKKKQHNITIGGYHASCNAVVLQTLLGSCVAVCLHDPQKKIGGMNHILLPGTADRKHFNKPGLFGVNAMELLINKIIKLGGRKDALTAKVFGGAHIMPSIGPCLAIGPKIIYFVKEFLQAESIPIINENTGGTDTITIFFHTDTGNVYLKRTPSTIVDKLAAQEMKLMQKLKR